MGTAHSAGFEKREYCGLVGVYSKSGQSVAHDIFLGLMNLQHRGQDAAGAAVSDGRKMSSVKKLGLVSDVLDPEAIAGLPGHAGIGHVRYQTIGGWGVDEAQPFIQEAGGKTFALAHNGNLSNYGRIRKEMEEGGTGFSSHCDSELILSTFTKEYGRTRDYFKACAEIMKKVNGSYSIVMATSDGEIIAFRDPHAIRPLCMGRDKDRVVFASESVALDVLKCRLEGDVAPGE